MSRDGQLLASNESKSIAVRTDGVRFYPDAAFARRPETDRFLDDLEVVDRASAFVRRQELRLEGQAPLLDASRHVRSRARIPEGWVAELSASANFTDEVILLSFRSSITYQLSFSAHPPSTTCPVFGRGIV